MAEQENSAFSKARQLDLRQDNEGVRLLRIDADDDGGKRTQRLLWISDGLDSRTVGSYPVLLPLAGAAAGAQSRGTFVPTEIAAAMGLPQPRVAGGPALAMAGAPAGGPANIAADPPEPELGQGALVAGVRSLVIGAALYSGVMAVAAILQKQGLSLHQETIEVAALLLGFGGFAASISSALPNRQARRAARAAQRGSASPPSAADRRTVGAPTAPGLVPSGLAGETSGGANATAAGAARGSMDCVGIAADFVNRSLECAKSHLKDATRHIAFGLNLFFAGAIRRIADLAGLDREQEQALAQGTLAILGTSTPRATKLMDDYETYRRNQSYVEIIEAGETAAEAFVKGEAQWEELAERAIGRWAGLGNPYADGIVVIMFTDIIGSTEITHARGDYAAQEMVRTHNQVVRKALADYFGKEVKHTGDGIMAVFSNAVNAIGAGMVIQQQLAAHARHAPDNAVRVRIGINAGEAVREEDDYFGTTVQVAARVCDKGEAGDVFVTEAVKMMCEGRNLPLAHVDAYELKGVDHRVDVYRVEVFAEQQRAKAS